MAASSAPLVTPLVERQVPDESENIFHSNGDLTTLLPSHLSTRGAAQEGESQLSSAQLTTDLNAIDSS
jgi:hypothetical protein